VFCPFDKADDQLDSINAQKLLDLHPKGVVFGGDVEEKGPFAQQLIETRSLFRLVKQFDRLQLLVLGSEYPPLCMNYST